MDNQTCCFTGHRAIAENERVAIQKRLEFEIVNLIHQGVRYFGAGGALGFDTMASLAVLKLKSEFPHIRLILVLPCKDQIKYWRGAEKEQYSQILSQADKVVYTSDSYYKGCMQKRNRHLVDNSRFCVCYMANMKGGTAYTVKYAVKRGLCVVNLVPNQNQ